MTVKLDGLEESIQAIYLATNNVETAVDAAIRAGAAAIQTEAVTSISQGAKTGRIYKRGNKIHQASAAGEAPATDSGDLVRRIQALKSIAGDGSWLVGTSLPYGKHLEFGTKDMGARPWLIPAMEKNRKNIENSIKSAIRKAT